MFSLFGHKEERKVLAVIEIGTGSVSATLTRLNRAGLPQILFYERVELPVSARRSAKALLAEVGKALTPLCRNLQKRAALYTEGTRIVPQKVKHAAVIFSAPWSDSLIRTLRMSRSKPFPMNGDVIERMLADEAKAVGKEHPSALPIERAIVGLRLNGYAVPAMTRAKVETAEVSLLLSFIDDNVLRLVREKIEEVLPAARQTYHSASFVSYLGTGTTFPEVPDYISVHVGGEMTEVSLVSAGTLRAVGSFPQGYNLVLRTLGAASIPPHEAASALKLSLADTSRMKAHLGKTLSAASLDWRKSLRGVLVDMIPQGGAPATVFLTVSGNTAPWFRETLAAEPFLSVTGTGAPSIRLLTPKEFLKKVAVGDAAPDAIALLASVFADRRFDEGANVDFLSTRTGGETTPQATLTA